MPEMVIEDPPRWRLLDLSYPTAFQNLALEEALARSSILPSFLPTVRLWRNPPAAIVGRFQDVNSEVDVEFCRQNDIAIGRRFTGGGAVFHDLGSLNLTIVTRRENTTIGELHERNSSILLDMLARFGVEGVLVPPNSILVNHRKISGAAAAVGNRYALWHASTLVSTDVPRVHRVLAPGRVAKETSSIRSKWHPVTSLTTILGRQVDIEFVKGALLLSCNSILGSKFERSGLREEEEQTAKLLLEQKYSSQDWNLRLHWNDEIERKREGAHTTIAV